MASLLSVMFVASSASGPRLLFAYPPNAVATPRVQRPLYGKSPAIRDAQRRSSGNGISSEDDESDDDGEDMFGSRFIRGESSSSSSSEDEDDDDLLDAYATREQRERDTYVNYLGMNTNVLGNLLCPGKELCNKRFEMVINHLAYIAHPAGVKTSSSSRYSQDRSSSRRGRGGNLGSPYGSDGEAEQEDEMAERSLYHLRDSRSLNESYVSGRSGSIPTFRSRRTSRSTPKPPSNLQSSRESSSSRQQLPSLQTPQTSNFDSVISADSSSRNSLTSRSYPLTSADESADGHQPEGKPSPPLSTPIPPPSVNPFPASELDVWGVVLVIDSPPDQHLSYHLGIYYRDVVVPVMAGLKYEERRHGYVTQEAAKIAAMRDTAIDTGQFVHRSQTCIKLC